MCFVLSQVRLNEKEGFFENRELTFENEALRSPKGLVIRHYS